MIDVFISYSSVDMDWVNSLADAFEKNGLSIWWDQKIIPGDPFHDKIQNSLDDASCVVVVWSKESIKSQWVKAEASQAFRKNILIPVTIDDSQIPLPFNSLHHLKMEGWDGNYKNKTFEKLMIGVSNFCKEINLDNCSLCKTSIDSLKKDKNLEVNTTLNSNEARIISKHLEKYIVNSNEPNIQTDVWEYVYSSELNKALEILTKATKDSLLDLSENMNKSKIVDFSKEIFGNLLLSSVNSHNVKELRVNNNILGVSVKTEFEAEIFVSKLYRVYSKTKPPKYYPDE